MKRIVLWLLSTVSVVVLLFGYSTSTSGPGLADTPPAVYSGSASTASSTTGSGESTSGSSGGSSSGSSDGSSGATSGGSSGGSSGSSTVTGDVASTEWGPVQVQLTVGSGGITAVDVLQYPNGNGKDAEINGYALPTLVQETLDQQDADIDMVSGATVTSTGYIQSLQSALDQAGL